jgi:hypothetical protein
MKVYIFEILDKAKPNKENLRGSSLEAGRRTIVQVTKLPL